MTVTVIANGLDKFRERMNRMPEISARAARLAINDTADTARRKIIPELIEKQVDFPPGYLADDDRLAVVTRATDGELTAVIAARARATSLARFTTGGTPGVTLPGGVPVRVKPGSGRTLPKAFLVRLRQGASLTEDHFNVGLAVRLKPGQTIRNKNVNVQETKSGITLLYGPSVDQVFRVVAEDVTDELNEMLETEFLRQFDRLS